MEEQTVTSAGAKESLARPTRAVAGEAPSTEESVSNVKRMALTPNTLKKQDQIFIVEARNISSCGRARTNHH